MELRDRVLYHQIHPVKLLTDGVTAAAATALLWRHWLTSALVVGFLPSILVTLALLRWADLEPYQHSAFGRYVGRFMTRRVEGARFAGLAVLWGGAWLRRPMLIALSVAWIAACWLWGIRAPARQISRYDRDP